MDRFGSSKLRIIWASVCLLLAGLVIGSIQGINAEGQLTLFGASLPLGFFDDPKAQIAQNLGRLVYSMVPAIILLGGIIPLGDWLAASGRGERTKGLLLGSGSAFLHGLFLSQLAILPILAASFRILGTVLAPSLLLADLNAVLLGLQLLLWAAGLGLVLKSNRGLAILLAYGLHEVGLILAWGGEFLGDMEVPKGLVKTMGLLGKALPSGQLPSEPPQWSVLPLGLGVPLALAALLILLPSKGAKRSKA